MIDCIHIKVGRSTQFCHFGGNIFLLPLMKENELNLIKDTFRERCICGISMLGNGMFYCIKKFTFIASLWESSACLFLREDFFTDEVPAFCISATFHWVENVKERMMLKWKIKLGDKF